MSHRCLIQSKTLIFFIDLIIFVMFNEMFEFIHHVCNIFTSSFEVFYIFSFFRSFFLYHFDL